jgi:DNA polymerase
MNADSPENRIATARILAWYEAMGVDAALADEAVDWLKRGDSAPGAAFALESIPCAPPAATARSNVPAAAPSTNTQRPPLRAPDASTARPARQFPARAPSPAEPAAGACQAKSLVELRTSLESFEGCGLKATAKNLCLYRGAEQAPLMIIGEAPGREEDLEGKPFVGRAGQLLDKMLAAIGMGEANVHIANIVYWRPPGNRTPTPQEALACRPFLERQVALVKPKVVLALGGAAAKGLFDVADGIMRIRGKWRDIEMGGHTAKAMATLHPAYLLRTPAAKGMAWRDLLAVKAALK